MAIHTTSTMAGSGALARILCGCLTLALSLICVISGLGSVSSKTGTDALTLWIFILWGAGLAAGGVWLIRGRSKGQAIVLVRDRRRILGVLLMAVLIVGLLIFLMSQPSIEDDDWWPLGLQTMFAVLFASLPFVLFDREDYKERKTRGPLDAAGRRKARRRILLLGGASALLVTAGLTLGHQIDPWWQEVLLRVGFGLLGAVVVLWYRLTKSARASHE